MAIIDIQLPIQSVLPDLRAALADAPSAILAAPPGSGKTTLVPLALLDAPWLAGRKILLLEPRRIAARACAQRMAELLGEAVGQTVGYRIRFEQCLSPQTRIEVVTEGILTRRLQQDPELAGVGLVIFDEFHERSIHADLALALCLDVQAGLRDDLRLLVMSATLDSDALVRLLGSPPVVKGEGYCYPVAVHYLEREPEGRIADLVAGGVLRALEQTQGDILAFLPGTGEIRTAAELLGARLAEKGIALCPLFGEQSREEQDHALRPYADGRRRVVLATAIAETSLTIEGVTTVVDGGWSRRPRFDPNSGLTRLETIRLSRASAEQRAGRAGRLGPGTCFRLWTEATQARLQPYTAPELLESDLAPLLLDLAQWGVTEPTTLRWLDPPPAGAAAQARELLQGLGALDGQGRITAEGQTMAGLGLHPRLSHLLLRAAQRGQGALASDLAALLAERDPMRRRPGESLPVDIEERIAGLARWRRQGAEGARASGLDIGGCRRIDQASRQWQRELGGDGRQPPGNAPLSIGALLSIAYPDRVARLRDPRLNTYTLSAGRGGRIPEGDLLGGREFLVAAHLDAGHRDGRILLAASVELNELRELHADRIEKIERVSWDDEIGAVAAVAEERLGELVLSSRRLQQPDPERVRAVLLEGIRRRGLQVLPWSDTALAWQARLRCLRDWQPEADWPDLSDAGLLASLEAWLLPWLDGMARLDHLQRLDLASILRELLPWARQQEVERLVPTHIDVPSGSHKRIDYRPGEPPVLAVRLQELFGLAETPTVCGGRVPLTLHLLSPAQRPIQITQDLKSFWSRTYPEVKKELKGRYPKHYWPDDPWNAQATARVRSKM